jgi:hypothetical protein
MLIGPSIAPSAPAAAPSRTEAAAPPLPAVAIAQVSAQPQTLRAAVPVTAGGGRNPLEDVRTRVAIQQLQARDREVRQHEQAHMAAAGGLLKSGPSYSFVTGPDGKRYAVGGSVEIDTSEVRDDPEANLDKGRRIQAAALAPAEPSGADLAVAKLGARIEQRARAEIARREAAANAYAEQASVGESLRTRGSASASASIGIVLERVA